MKISKIKIENLFGIEQLELNGNPVEIVGKKASGKTSVLDAIKVALTNKSERDYIVKNGEKEGQIFIKTSAFDITRKKRLEKGDILKVVEDGQDVNSPQSFLNDIFTPLQLDPIEFTTWKKEHQNRAILDLIEFDWDLDWIKNQFGELPPDVNYNAHILEVLDQIQSEKGYYWKQRAEANKSELYKRQQIQDMVRTLPANYNVTKWKNYNLQESIVRLNEIQKSNNIIRRAKAFVEDFKNKVRGIEADRDIKISAEETAINTNRVFFEKEIERLKGEIVLYQEKLNNLDNEFKNKKELIIKDYENEYEKLENSLNATAEYIDKPIVDVEELQNEIEEATKMKEYVSEYNSMLSMKKECEELIETSKHYDAKINLARTLPGTILETAVLPVENLTVENGIPLLNGLPISNLSDGEKIELCVDVTLSKQHKLDIILLNGVEQLDDESRQKIYDKCKQKGLQIIAARTTNHDELTIIEL